MSESELRDESQTDYLDSSSQSEYSDDSTDSTTCEDDDSTLMVGGKIPLGSIGKLKSARKSKENAAKKHDAYKKKDNADKKKDGADKKKDDKGESAEPGDDSKKGQLQEAAKGLLSKVIPSGGEDEPKEQSIEEKDFGEDAEWKLAPLYGWILWLWVLHRSWTYAQKSVDNRFQLHIMANQTRSGAFRGASRQYLCVLCMYMVAEAYYHALVISIFLLAFFLFMNFAIRSHFKPPSKIAKFLLRLFNGRNAFFPLQPQHIFAHVVVFITCIVLGVMWVVLYISKEDLMNETITTDKFKKARAFVPVYMTTAYVLYMVQNMLCLSG